MPKQRVTFSPMEHGYQDILLDGVVVGQMGPSSEVWVAFKVEGRIHDVSVARFKYKALGYSSKHAVARAWVKAVLSAKTPAEVVADLDQSKRDRPTPSAYAEQFGFKPYILPPGETLQDRFRETLTRAGLGQRHAADARG
jgi:hypothetical protein